MTSPPMAPDVGLIVMSMMEVSQVVRNVSSVATSKTTHECLRLGAMESSHSMHMNKRQQTKQVH